jgi:2-polyprenyl-6-methoxyphenol hydroxylase-like FAD-dependent oxidoreductase
MSVPKKLSVDCCIAGGGPAGMMLGMLLARAGLEVAVLEKHADFFRDFRGDTIHPSTIELLGELGLRDEFLALPHTTVRSLDAVINGHRLHPVDFGYLKPPNNFLVLMPQWDFLNFLAEKAAAYPGFHLLMSTEATGLLHDEQIVSGVRASSAAGDIEISARLTVAADGRDSTLRRAAGLSPHEYGVGIDVLWFHLAVPPDAPPDTLGYLDAASMLITIPRGDYYQVGLVITKGGLAGLQQAGLDEFRRVVASAAPFLENSVREITDWDQVKLLSVQIDRLERWHLPGMLVIGDAAHAMSPAFGVGVNYAIQDAVAAANALVRPLRFGSGTAVLEEDCAGVQKRRMPAVTRMQALQLQVHKRLAKPGGGAILPAQLSRQQKTALAAAMPLIKRFTARMIGRGFVQEHLCDDLKAEPRRLTPER